MKALGIEVPSGASREELRALFDLHVGTPERIVEELAQDHVLADATDIVFQTHPIDPPHDLSCARSSSSPPKSRPPSGGRPPSHRSPMSDLIDDLVGIAPGSTLDALRAKRPVAREDAQATYEGLIVAPADLARATPVERAAIGYWVSA